MFKETYDKPNESELQDFEDLDHLPPGTHVFSTHPDGRQARSNYVVLRKVEPDELSEPFPGTLYIACPEGEKERVSAMTADEIKAYRVQAIHLFPADFSFPEAQELAKQRDDKRMGWA